MVDFSKLASKTLGEIDKPKPLPTGTYEGLIDGVPKWAETAYVDKDSGEKLPVVKVTYQLTAAGDDVDEEELQEAGGLLLKNGKRKTITQDFVFNGNEPPYRLRKFLEGFNATESSTLAEALETISGERVLVTISHRVADGETYQQVNKAIAAK